MLRNFLRNNLTFIQYFSLLLKYPYRFKNYLSKKHAVTVLLYHKITRESWPHDQSAWAVSLQSFKHQMRFLKETGYRVLSANEYLNYLNKSESFPRKSILITFDDGYKNNFELAYPVLKHFNFPAIIFLASGYIGSNKTFPWDKNRAMADPSLEQDCLPLTWEEIRNMKDLIALGSHTVTHPHLAKEPVEKIDWELRSSKQTIEKEINHAVQFFSYPGGTRHYGEINSVTEDALKIIGYKIAFNSEIGTNISTSNPHFQNRIAVEEDRLPLFEAKLIGAYNWMRLLQWVFQKLFKYKSDYTSSQKIT